MMHGQDAPTAVRPTHESRNTQSPRLRFRALLTEGYVPYKVQTAPAYVFAPHSPEVARHV
jgi:hypothetical protein